MATFNIVLDKRTKLKEEKYNLAVRMINENDVMYINLHDSLRYIRNRFENFKPDVNVEDGTVSFLKKFPRENQLHD